METQEFEKVSRDFWAKQVNYPGYDYIKDRRMYELLYTLPKIKEFNPKTIVDIGCGTGSTVTLLRELSYTEKYYCYDVAPGMLSAIDCNPDRDSEVVTGVIDFTEENYELPENVDFCICYGLLQCIDDDSVKRVLSRISAKKALFRSACELEKRNVINTYSEKLGSDYGCSYRTIDEYYQLFEEAGFKVISHVRCYPDVIESKFGTKQYFFDCEKI